MQFYNVIGRMEVELMQPLNIKLLWDFVKMHISVVAISFITSLHSQFFVVTSGTLTLNIIVFS